MKEGSSIPLNDNPQTERLDTLLDKLEELMGLLGPLQTTLARQEPPTLAATITEFLAEFQRIAVSIAESTAAMGAIAPMAGELTRLRRHVQQINENQRALAEGMARLAKMLEAPLVDPA